MLITLVAHNAGLDGRARSGRRGCCERNRRGLVQSTVLPVSGLVVVLELAHGCVLRLLETAPARHQRSQCRPAGTWNPIPKRPTLASSLTLRQDYPREQGATPAPPSFASQRSKELLWAVQDMKIAGRRSGIATSP